MAGEELFFWFEFISSGPDDSAERLEALKLRLSRVGEKMPADFFFFFFFFELIKQPT